MLHLHRSERADALVPHLAALLREPLADPFTPDVVAVPTRGVERWLAQQLSHHLGTGPDGDGRDGICANVAFESPARVVDRVLTTALGRGGTAGADDDDPWHPDRLTWHLLTVIDTCTAEPWCTALSRHLGHTIDDDVRRGRRLQAARHLARLLTAYAAQRPAMIEAWAAGRDDDGTGRPLPADLTWQAELWRRLRAHVGVPSPAERWDEALSRLVDRPDDVPLPDRLSVFGATRLPQHHLRVLDALARHRDVHLWLPHPSPALWQRVVDREPVGTPRRADRVPAARHPLLASMARDATELQERLLHLDASSSTTTQVHHHPAPEPAPTGEPTLLGELQRRLRDDDAAAPVALPATDRSVQVHACHGRARQVEVLRETLIGLFADDPDLEPRDVVVMCPDVEAFAPLITATFGAAPTFGTAGPAGDVHPGRSLRVRLADRSLRQTNPVLAVLSRLLELPDGRVTASDVLDLAAAGPVRHRFGFDDDDLDRLREWAVTAGARWGEDRGRRTRFGLGGVGQGTWEAALDRVLLGVAMAEEDERFLGSALPLDDVDSTDVDLAGRLAELVDRLTRVLARLDGTHHLDGWLDALDHALDLLTDVAPTDGWQDVEARRVLADTRLAGGRHGTLELRLDDLRALLADRLQGRPTRAGFRTGALTVCSLEPMRAVPHRVVCLLGMDDGAFPRGTGTDGDDVLLRDPLIGERDRRSEDRQLFLDALTAAEDHLIVLYSGAHERTGAMRPPAVPVGELLDALDRTAVVAGTRARDHVVVRHPLQQVDERSFVDGALGRPGPFSFDAVAHRAALAGRDRRTPGPFLPSPLAPAAPSRRTAAIHAEDPGTVDLDDLVAALEHPVRTFVRQRLGVTLPGEVSDVADRLPLSLDPLEQWSIGDRLLTAFLAGVDPDRAVQAEWRRGEVPPRRLGGALLDELRTRIDPVAAAALAHRGTEPARTVDVGVDLPDGRRLAGTVPGVHGSTVVRAVYSRLGPKHRLRAWVQLLALAATPPGSGRPRASHPGPAEAEGRYSAATIGRGPGTRPQATVASLTAPTPDDAVAHLATLVTLRDRALREPLPLPVETACRYAHSRAAGDEEVQALDAARRTWDSGFEKGDDHHALLWGAGLAFDDLLGTPTASEQAAWPEDRTRLGVLARTVWQPVTRHERTQTA